MKFVVKFFQSNGRQILGSDGTAIFSDLKTLAGVHRRLKRYYLPRYAESYKVFRVPEGHFYKDESEWALLEEGLVGRSPRATHRATAIAACTRQSR